MWMGELINQLAHPHDAPLLLVPSMSTKPRTLLLYL